MDLLLQSGKAGGVLGELFSPEWLLLLKLRVNFLKSLPSRRNGLARLGTKTEEHRPASVTLLPLLAFYPRGGSAALLGSAPACGLYTSAPGNRDRNRASNARWSAAPDGPRRTNRPWHGQTASYSANSSSSVSAARRNDAGRSEADGSPSACTSTHWPGR